MKEPEIVSIIFKPPCWTGFLELTVTISYINLVFSNEGVLIGYKNCPHCKEDHII